MKPYSELSRRGRLHRTRELARAALEGYGMDAASLKFLQYFGNIIYRVDVPGYYHRRQDDGVFIPGRYILRIHGMGDADAIRSEMTWLAALNQEADLPVPAPVPAANGSLLVTIHTESIPNCRVVTLMRWLDGRRYQAGLRPKHLQALGEVLARMHAFSAGWQPPDGFSRPQWDWDSMLGGSLFSRQVDELVDGMPVKFREPFLGLSREAKTVMDSLGKGPDAFGMIHADLYPENVLFKAGRALPIDFEDSGFGFWMWDIAVALCQWAWGSEWERMRDALHEGYSQIRILSEYQWSKLDLFVAIQFATMLLWFSEFLISDPKRAGEYEPLRNFNGDKLLDYMSQ